jgi:hypothetical protein
MAANGEKFSDPELNELLSLHEEIKSSNFAAEQIDKSGKFLADKTLTYFNNPKNKKFLNTVNGQKLITNQKLLLNYLALKDHLEKCVKSNDDKRKLKDRILSTTLQELKTNNSLVKPCIPKANSIKNFQDFNNQVMGIVKLQSTPDFIENLSEKLLLNSMKSLIGLKYKLDPNFMKQNVLTENEMNQILSEICFKNSCSKLSKDFKKNMQKEASDFVKNLPLNENRFDNETAAKSMNASLDKINQALSKIKLENNKGIFFDSAVLNNPESKKQFDEYILTYMTEASKDVGPLLLTKTMREKAGEIKSYHDDETVKDKKTNTFKFEIHKHISSSDISNSYKEAYQKILESSRSTEKVIAKEALRKNSKRNYSDIYRKDDINQLVKINPVAAGQILVHNPEYAGMVCDSINAISKMDKDGEELDNYFMVGSAILGGALLLTGVGTMAGAYLLSGSVTAGIAAGTVGGTIMSTTVLAGAALETVNGCYYGKKSYDSYVETKKIEEAFFSNNTDNTSIVEKKEAYLAFTDARMKASIAFVSAGVSIVRLDQLFDLKYLALAANKVTTMKATTKILETLSDSAVVSKINASAKLIGGHASEMFDQFFLKLATVSEKVRLSVLELLKDNRLTPLKLRELVEKSLEIAKKCVKN